jgi:ADP-ribose pyrophosphatase YjhB (NUDIX family)
MALSREYPDRPLVGVGGVVITHGRALLIRRGAEPLKGQWSIPGGMLELGETIAAGVVRELREETGLEVRVVELIEVFERIFISQDLPASRTHNPGPPRPRYHFVILDYLCEQIGGELCAASDVTDVAFAGEEELPRFHLTETATRVLQKAFAMSRMRGAEEI